MHTITISSDDSKLALHVECIQQQLTQDGQTYTPQQVQRALWHWLQQAIDALIDDAEWHTTERDGFARADFERALREVAKPESLSISYDGFAYWMTHRAGALLLDTQLYRKREELEATLQHVDEVGHEWHGLRVIRLDQERVA